MPTRTCTSLKYLTFLCALIGVTGGLVTRTQQAQAAVLYNAVAAGDATSNDAILWTRTIDSTTQQGITSNLTTQVSTDPSFNSISYSYNGATDATRDYTLKLDATGLQSDTRYYYRFQAPDGSLSSTGTFKTAPDSTQAVPIHFGFSGDADGQWRPYASTANFNQLNFDYFVFIGDTIYETGSKISPTTSDPFANPTQALADYNRKYLEQLQPVQTGGFTGLQTFFASQGNYTLLDNHELGNKQFINGGAAPGTPAGKGVDATNPANDVNTTGTFINKTAGFKVLEQAYDNYEPIREKTISAPADPRTDGTQQLYFAQQWGKNSILINVDDRSYRDIRLKTASGADDTGSRADNPGRTILGTTQLNWLEQTLLSAQANGEKWKIIAISSPIDQVGGDGGKSWIGGYRSERNQLLKFIADNHIDNVVFLTTDDHQNRINELTYLSDPSNPNSLTVVPNTFTIVAGPIGAGGPDAITDHSFSNIKSLADTLATSEQSKGINPIGLAANYPGLQNVFREGDPNADTLRQPVDFYSPDTFNYVSLDISADGSQLAVNTYGINSYAANTFPEPSQTGSPRRILGFQINAAVAGANATSVPEPTYASSLLAIGAIAISVRLKPRHKIAKLTSFLSQS